MSLLDQPSLLPDDRDLELLHCRQYETRTYRLDADHLLVRGGIRDTKPPGLYVTDDPSPLVIHDMMVDLTVAIDGFVITDAEVSFLSFPNESCPKIIDHYSKLVGLNIARGFNRKVRELFGGPRGCAHTSALLQAMAPAVVQTIWSLTVANARAEGRPPAETTDADRERSIAANLNTCHIWDEQGEHIDLIRKGDHTPRPPLSVETRLRELGRDPQTWFQ